MNEININKYHQISTSALNNKSLQRVASPCTSNNNTGTQNSPVYCHYTQMSYRIN